MQANYVQRLRLTFSKVGPTRFIGHLDLARTLERSLNRAHVPVAYTQGFNQRPRMQLANALPLGFTSECELVDIWLKEVQPPAKVHQQLTARIAPGLIIHRVEEIPLAEPPLQTLTDAASYRVTLLDPVDPAGLAADVAALLAAESLPRRRRQKRYDLRPLIRDLQLLPAAGDEPQTGLVLRMDLLLRPGETGRPDEVLDELGLDPLAARVHRTALLLAETPHGVDEAGLDEVEA